MSSIFIVELEAKRQSRVATLAQANRSGYNSTGYGHRNQRHEFSYLSSDNERKALVEYLKTL